MNPLNLDGMSQFLGPGLGGLWMGEQQGLAVDAEKLRQQKTLEDLMTAAQTRDIAKQKLPFELQEMEARTGQTKANTALTTQNTEANAEKLKRDKFQAFLGDLSKMDPRSVSMEDRAGFLNDVASRHGIPQDHPMYLVALRAHAQGGPAWDNFTQAFDVSSEAKFKESQANARTDRSNDRMEANTRLTLETQERIRREDREAKMRLAQMRMQEGQSAESKRNYAQAFTAYVAAADAADAAGEVQEGARLRQRAQLMLEADAAVRGAAQNTPKAGQPQLPPGSGIDQRQPQPLPQVAPLTPPTAQGPASSVPAPRQMTPQDQQAMAWARANPQDPRSKAILQKLGVQ